MISTPTLHVPITPLPSSPPPRPLSGMDKAIGTTIPVPSSSPSPTLSHSSSSHRLANNRQLPRCNAIYIPSSKKTSMPPPSWIPSRPVANVSVGDTTPRRPLPALPSAIKPASRPIAPKPKSTLHRPLEQCPSTRLVIKPAFLHDSSKRLDIRDYAYPSSFKLVIPRPAPKPSRTYQQGSNPDSSSPPPEQVEEFEQSAEEYEEERKQIEALQLKKDQKVAAMKRRRTIGNNPSLSVELEAPRAKRVFDVQALERRALQNEDETLSPSRKPRSIGTPLPEDRKLPKTFAIFDGKQVPRDSIVELPRIPADDREQTQLGSYKTMNVISN